jgi:hypothetical protein
MLQISQFVNATRARKCGEEEIRRLLTKNESSLGRELRLRCAKRGPLSVSERGFGGEVNFEL